LRPPVKTMKREEILTSLSERFKDDIIELYDRSATRVYIEIAPKAIVRMATYVFRNLGARFNTASGVDCRNHIEILYHFTIEDINLLISLRVKLNKDALEIDSLTPVMEGANWIEREMHELLGINFKGHSDLRRLLLSDQWPEGVYPLRCEYKEWDDTAIRDRGA
jgi:Ni,Fe-hydrogenase III component G